VRPVILPGVKPSREPYVKPIPVRLAAAMALLTLSLGLAACGVKGPLYLPDEQPPASTDGR